MKAIGIIKLINIDALKEYVLSRKEYEELFTKEKEQFELMYDARIFPETVKVRYEYGSGTYDAAYGESKHKGKCRDLFNMFFKLWDNSYYRSDDPDYSNKYNVVELLKLQHLYEYTQEYGQPLHYIYKSDFGYYMEGPDFKAFIPAQFVEAQPFVDYSNTPLRLIGANENMSKNLPDVGDETQTSLKSKLEDKKAEIEEKVAEIKAKEEEQKVEIERMKREIEKKYEGAFALMQAKKEELEMMLQQLQGQLFVLDTQIYGIRCFFGETVKFTKITSGNNAPIEAPLVMYQKVRFLDEEMAKYAAIYGFDGEDTALFEKLLTNRPDMRDLFFPAGKSLSLVRISKDGAMYKSGQSARVSGGGGSVSIYNVMQEYEVLHGNKIAILVRNGDNCYIGWTEEDRICVSDGNAFLTPKESAVADDAEVKKDYKGNVIEEKTDKKEVAARYFIFSIAQGLIENSKLLELPKVVSLTQNSPYVVFSMADNWLEDTTYGSYDDIMEKCSVNIRKGDNILTLRSLSAEGEKYRSYNNDRGRGYNNRTHDVKAKDNTIYPVNLVEDDEYDNLVLYECKCKDSKNWEPSSWSTRKSEETYMQDFNDYHDTKNWEYRNIRFAGPIKHVFISLAKDNWWSNSDARANFELYSDEYINLTFLNTVYMRYIIVNRKMPNKFISGRTNFSSFLPYLNKSMEFLKERELKEEELISKYTELDVNWQIALTDWKLEHNVHEITDYQAKRFAKSYKNESLSK